MNMNSIYKVLALGLWLTGCSSGPFVQSKDVCELKRHHQDDLYQVTINEQAINKHFYLKADAIEIANQLASREVNKCAPRTF